MKMNRAGLLGEEKAVDELWANEKARQKALAAIKAAGEPWKDAEGHEHPGDWRAKEAFLKYSFWPDYRQGPAVNVTTTATTQTAVVCSEEDRKRLIALRELREKIVHGAHGATALNNAPLNGELTGKE